MLSEGQKRHRNAERQREWRMKNKDKWTKYQKEYQATHKRSLSVLQKEKLQSKIREAEVHLEILKKKLQNG